MDRDTSLLTEAYGNVLNWVKSKMQKTETFRPKYGPVPIANKNQTKPPVRISTGTAEGDIDLFTKQPFTALEHAMEVGHHPKLWRAVKGTPFETRYIEEVTGGKSPEAA